jgi:hypothetical protein
MQIVTVYAMDSVTIPRVYRHYFFSALIWSLTLVYSVYRLRFLLAFLYLLMIRELSLLKIFVGSYPL